MGSDSPPGGIERDRLESRVWGSGLRVLGSERIGAGMPCLSCPEDRRLDPPLVVGPPLGAELRVLGEEALLQDLVPREGSGQEAQVHGGGLAAGFLALALEAVGPDGEDREAFHGGLPGLAEGDGLAAVVGLAVTEAQVGEVDGEEGIGGGAPGARGGDVVTEGGTGGVATETCEGAEIGGVIITVEVECLSRGDVREEGSQQGGDGELDGFGMRSAVAGFEECAAEFLMGCHAALAAQGGVIEGVEEAAAGSDGEVGVEGEVLGELEGLEAVEDEGFGEEKGAGGGGSHALRLPVERG